MSIDVFLGYSLENGRVVPNDPDQTKIYFDQGVAAEWLRAMEEDGQESILPDNVAIIDPVVFRSNIHLRPKYKYIIANKHGLPHDQFVELYGWKAIIGKKRLSYLLSFFRKWRGRLIYREFKGKSKRGC